MQLDSGETLVHISRIDGRLGAWGADTGFVVGADVPTIVDKVIASRDKLVHFRMIVEVWERVGFSREAWTVAFARYQGVAAFMKTKRSSHAPTVLSLLEKMLKVFSRISSRKSN